MGFGIGVLLILCTWAARALLDGTTNDAERQDARSATLATGRSTVEDDGTATAEGTPPVDASGGAAGSRPTVDRASEPFDRVAERANKKGLVGDGDVASPVDVLVSLGVVIAVMVGK